MELSNGVDCEPILSFGDEQVGGTHPVHCDSILRDFGNEPCRLRIPRVAPCLTKWVIVLGVTERAGNICSGRRRACSNVFTAIESYFT